MPRATRARSQRAISNDESIRESAIRQILRDGVDHVSLRVVGLEAGLTHGATYARFEDVDELLADLWNSRLDARVRTIFGACERAVSEPGRATRDSLVAIMRRPEPVDVAAILCLYSARRIPVLAEEVETFLSECLEHGTNDTPPRSHEFSKTVILFSLAAVQIFAHRFFDWNDAHLSLLNDVVTNIVEGSSGPTSSTSLSDVVGPLAPDDDADLRAHLSWATFRVVGRSGYTQATISRIARRAHCSPGAMYKIYPSKDELVAAAFEDLMHERWLTFENFAHVLEPGAIERMVAGVTCPANDVRRSFFLEYSLAAAYSERLAVTMRRQIRELEAHLDQVTGVSDVDRQQLVAFVRVLSLSVFGLAFLSKVVRDIHAHDLASLVASLRQRGEAISPESWSTLSECSTTRSA